MKDLIPFIVQCATYTVHHWGTMTTDFVTFVYAIEKAGGLRVIWNNFMGPKSDEGATSTQTHTQSNEKTTVPPPIVPPVA